MMMMAEMVLVGLCVAICYLAVCEGGGALSLIRCWIFCAVGVPGIVAVSCMFTEAISDGDGEPWGPWVYPWDVLG